MDLLSLSEHLANLPTGEITLEPALCAHSRDRFSSCNLCADACPTGAITIDPLPSLNTGTCVACGACLHVCPLGAFFGEDGVRDLFQCFSRLEAPDALELLCPLNSHPAVGPAPARPAIRCTRCLASLGSSAYLGLAALGAGTVSVRLEDCPSCPLSAAQATINASLDQAASIGKGWGLSQLVLERSTAFTEGWGPRPFYEAKNPPLSRRDLFRMAASEGTRMAATLLSTPGPRDPRAKGLPIERSRLNSARSHLQTQGNLAPTDAPSGVLSSASFLVDTTCDGCQACVRACPCAALGSEAIQTEDGPQFRLTFLASACTGCGICVDFCFPKALHLEGKASWAELAATEAKTLFEAPLHTCTRCGAAFAGEAPDGLCPICKAREQNPFTFLQPPFAQAG